jgi:hypothetical protein
MGPLTSHKMEYHNPTTSLSNRTIEGVKIQHKTMTAVLSHSTLPNKPKARVNKGDMGTKCILIGLSVTKYACCETEKKRILGAIDQGFTCDTPGVTIAATTFLQYFYIVICNVTWFKFKFEFESYL